MYAAIQGFDPSSPRAVAFYDDSVRQLNAALEARRDRLDDAGGGLPWVIAVLLIVGSIIIVGYTVLVGSRSFWFHAIGAGAVALVLGLSLVVLLDLTYPFSGDLSVSSAPFRTRGPHAVLRAVEVDTPVQMQARRHMIAGDEPHCSLPGRP